MADTLEAPARLHGAGAGGRSAGARIRGVSAALRRGLQSRRHRRQCHGERPPGAQPGSPGGGGRHRRAGERLLARGRSAAARRARPAGGAGEIEPAADPLLHLSPARSRRGRDAGRDRAAALRHLAGVARGLEALATWHAARRPRLAPPPAGRRVAAATRALDAAGETLCEYEAAPLLTASAFRPRRPASPVRPRKRPGRPRIWASHRRPQDPVARHPAQDRCRRHRARAGRRPDAVARACAAMLERGARAARPEADIRGVLVQPGGPGRRDAGQRRRRSRLRAAGQRRPGRGPRQLLATLPWRRRRSPRRRPRNWSSAWPAAASWPAGAARPPPTAPPSPTSWRGCQRLAHDFAGRIAEIGVAARDRPPRRTGLTVVDALVRQRPETDMTDQIEFAVAAESPR